METEELLTYKQVAEILRVSKATVNRYSKQEVNPLPVLYLNPLTKRSPRIKKTDLKEWIQCLEDDRRDV